MMTKRILLIACLIASPLFAIDMDKLEAQLGSDDYTARKEARSELQLALASATKPGADGQERKAIENTVLAQIKSNLPLSERLYLIHMLELFGSSEMAAPLNELLSDKDPHVCDSARRALSALPGDAATSHLTAALENAPASLQSAYLQALAYRRDDKAQAVMTRFLQSGDTSVVANTALALSKAGKAEQVPELIKARTKAPATAKPVIETAIITLGLDAEMARELTVSGSNPGIQSAAFMQLLSLDAKAAETYLTTILTQPDLAARNKIFSQAVLHGSASTQAHLVKALPSAPHDVQIVILSAIGQLGLSEYEAPLIAMIDLGKPEPGKAPVESKDELQNALIDTLSRIGRDASFAPLNKALSADPENKTIIAAISQLKAPGADQEILVTAKTSKDIDERITAIQLLTLRNVSGSVDVLNSIVSTTTDQKIRAAALMHLETIGNDESLRILVQQTLDKLPADKDMQRGLKRMSLHLGEYQAQWDNIYSPALKNAASDNNRESLVEIIDGIPCQAALNYLTELALDVNSSLQPAAIRTLQRWPSIDVGNSWLAIASSKESPAKDIATAESSIHRLLSKYDRKSVGVQMELLANAIKNAPNPEFKRKILSAYAEPNSGIKKQLKDALTPFQTDPDVGDQVKEIINRL